MTSRIRHFIIRNPLIVFFPLAIGISWSIGIPLAVAAAGRTDRPLIPFAFHYLVGYGPMLAALLLTWITEGRKGLRELLTRILKWRVRPVWWLVALSPLLVFAIIAAGQRLWQGQWPELAQLGQVQFLPNLGWGALFLWIFTFGFGEEIGWRGYALPRLQDDHSAFKATLILSLFLALWHVPAFFYLYDPAILLGWFFGMIAGAFVFTWLYNSSRGSILVIALFHGAFNFISGSQVGEGVIAAVLSILVMVWAVLLVLIYKPVNLATTRRQVISTAKS